MIRTVKPYLIAIFFILAGLCCRKVGFAQKVTTFQKSFGGGGDEYGTALVALPDKGYILGGITNSFGAGGYDILLIRTDSLGRQVWAKTYGGTSDEGKPYNSFNSAVDMVLTPDFNVVVCSNTKSYGAGGADVYLFKIDLNGSVRWSKTYGGTGDDFGYGIVNDPNGGFMITGETLSFGTGNGDVFLIKTDTGGRLIWANAYGNSSYEEAGLQIKNSRDGNFLISGYTEQRAGGLGSGMDEMLMKVNDAGTLLFNKVYGTASDEFAESIIDLPDASIYTSGGNTSNLASVFSKYDKNGKLLWCKMYDQNQHVFTANVLYDQSKNDFNSVYIKSGPGHMGIIRLDTAGNIIFTKIYGPIIGAGYYTDGYGSYLAQTSSGFALNYTTSSFGAGGVDYFFAKVDTGASNSSACNITSPAVSSIDFTSSIHNYTYTFSTLVANAISGSGIITAAANVKDAFVCPPFIAYFNSKTVCIGQATPFFDSSYYQPTSWLWDFGDPSSTVSNSSSLQNPTHIYSAAGTYNVKLVSGNGSLTDSIVRTVTVLPQNVLLKTFTDSVCPGDSIHLYVPGFSGDQFSWSPGSTLNDTTDSTVWARPLKKTTYVETITNSTGCSFSDSFIVKITQISIPPIGNKSSCGLPVTLSLNAYPNAAHLWSTGETADSITVSQPGKYWLRIINNGCKATDTSLVTFLAPAQFSNDNLNNTLFCSDDSALTLDAGPAYRYLWTPGGDTNRVIKVLDGGIYTAEIIAADGCTAVKSANITNQCTPYLYVPDAFTPNEDKTDDEFRAISRYPLENFSMQVYNRWGEKLFESNDINLGWDGTFKGWDGTYKQPFCSPGTYIYSVKYKYQFHVAQARIGTVTLLR